MIPVINCSVEYSINIYQHTIEKNCFETFIFTLIKIARNCFSQFSKRFLIFTAFIPLKVICLNVFNWFSFPFTNDKICAKNTMKSV